MYLVGDIFDHVHPSRPFWNPHHDRIVTVIRARAAAGMDLVLLAGNHDASPSVDGLTALGVAAVDRAVHHSARGQSYLVLHGEVCDSRLLRWHLWTRLGSRIDAALRSLDTRLRRLRGGMPPDRRSLIERLLAAVSAALALGSAHERKLAALAQAQGHHGVVCGHFHKPALRDLQGIFYANCGDWVDSLTAIAEDAEGHLHLLAAPAPVPAAAVGPALHGLEPAL